MRSFYSLYSKRQTPSHLFFFVSMAQFWFQPPRSHIGTVESNIGEIIPDTRRSSLCGRQPFDLLTIVIPALNLSPMPVIWFDLKSQLSKKNQKQCYPCRWSPWCQKLRQKWCQWRRQWCYWREATYYFQWLNHDTFCDYDDGDDGDNDDNDYNDDIGGVSRGAQVTFKPWQLGDDDDANDDIGGLSKGACYAMLC